MTWPTPGKLLLVLSSGLLACVAPLLRSAQKSQSELSQNPWAQNEVLEPARLAKMLETTDRPPVISVAFPVLYRQRHIAHAQFAGPGSKPEGLDALEQAVAALPKDAEIVIYCGCCPMDKCPNIRPAYRRLKELGFSTVRVLDLPTNFHTDWVSKGYPVEP